MSAAHVRVLEAGGRAVLLAPDDHADLAGLVDRLRADTPAGVQDVLPAAETVLVVLGDDADRAAVQRRLLDVFEASRPASVDRTVDAIEPVTVPVRYDGPDLPDVAALLGVDVEDVIAAHTGRTWRCAFIGFAPGFGYLESTMPGLAVPRRTQSRTAVPAGAVALADGYSAVYPRRSPGGWQIIGTTEVPMWSLDRPEPALLQPGTVVRFVDEGTR